MHGAVFSLAVLTTKVWCNCQYNILQMGMFSYYVWYQLYCNNTCNLFWHLNGKNDAAMLILEYWAWLSSPNVIISYQMATFWTCGSCFFYFSKQTHTLNKNVQATEWNKAAKAYKQCEAVFVHCDLQCSTTLGLYPAESLWCQHNLPFITRERDSTTKELLT